MPVPLGSVQTQVRVSLKRNGFREREDGRVPASLSTCNLGTRISSNGDSAMGQSPDMRSSEGI
jgi:hypothetical protein